MRRGDVQQQTHSHQQRDERRTAIAQEGQRDAGEGNQFEVPRDDDPALDANPGSNAPRQQRLEGGFAPLGEAQAALDEHCQQRQQRQRARRAELVDQRCVDEIAVDDGNQIGPSQTQSLPEQPSSSDGKQRLENLEGAVGLFRRPWIEPDARAQGYARRE